MKLTKKRRHNDFSEQSRIVESSDMASALWRINWKKLGFQYCGVYVITTDSLYPCKIGISQNPASRVANLQTAHWRQIQITEYRWCRNVHDAKKIEEAAHRFLAEKDKQLLGEWFDVRPKEAVEAIEWASLMENIEVNSGVPEDARKIADNHAGDSFSGFVNKENDELWKWNNL